MATATKPSPVVNSPATHQRSSNQRGAHQRGIPAARLASVVDRTSKLSDDVLKSLEAGQRAAIEAVGQFLLTVEEALSEEVKGASDVPKKITESALEMAQQLVHTQYDFLRQVIDSTSKSLSSHDGARRIAVK
jgi:hypothetical protein